MSTWILCSAFVPLMSVRDTWKASRLSQTDEGTDRGLKAERIERTGNISEKIFIYPIDIYTQNGYNKTMIKSFADKETEKVYNQIFSKKIPQSIQRIALRKLIMIDNAGCLEDLRVPPANHLELLQGDRAGQYSIRINGQYRVCFNIEGNDFFNVEIVDYH